ncbi:MAG: AraC family ligand binding domain-containing protein [Candidatus Aenigmarchaeota archaeon]|nr:AraC family ligand binding domain-containing protein [Candidatus Aenigmarchaeota archaeon]
MLIKKSESTKIENSKECIVWEYEYPSRYFSFATALIDGRYPEEKQVTNLECEEIYYVISGSGTVHSEKGNFEINEGDLYFFEKGEVYWVEGDKLLLALVNAPKWTPEQHKVV